MVYRAIQEYPERVVALKVMRPTIWQSKAAARFHREIQILAKLQHPAIARLYTAGTMSGPGGSSPFLAMELVSGVPVTSFVRGKTLAQRLRITIEICDAVAYAHGEGIIHRDIKPANVLVDAGGHVKVLDFGLGTLLTERHDMPALTEAGQFLGTPDYMSPEQAGGARLDERADVYSLGVLLYELVAGRRPRDLSSQSMIEASRILEQEEAPSLRSVCSGTHRDLEIIVAKAMAREPHRRYSSAATLADDLRRFLDKRPITARPSTALYRASRLLRRHCYLALSTTLIIASLAAGLGLALRAASNARMHDRLAQIQLAEAQVAQADMYLVTGDVTRARELYLTARDGFVKNQASPLPAALGLWELDSHTAFPLRTLNLSGLPRNVALSGDGSMLCIVNHEGGILLEDAPTGKILWEASMGDGAMRAAFSSDVSQLAVLSATSFTIFQSQTGKVLRTDSLPLNPILLAVGRKAFCALSAEGQLVVIPMDAALPVAYLTQEHLRPLAAFDTSERLWTVASEGNVYRASGPTWKLEKVGYFPQPEGANLTIGDDATWVARGTPDKVEFWTPTGTEILTTVVGPPLLPSTGSPPNTLFRFDRASGLVELVEASGKVALRIPSKDPRRITAGGDLAFVEDSSRSFTLWQDRSLRSLRRLKLGNPPTGPGAISRDGRIAAISTESQIEVLDAGSGRLLSAISTGKPVVDLSLDRAASTLAACTSENRIQFWNLSDGKSQLAAEAGPVAKKIALAPSGNAAISCNGDEPPVFWTKSSSGQWTFHQMDISEGFFAEFSDDDEQALTMGIKDVHIWSTHDHLHEVSSIHTTSSLLRGSAFMNKGSSIATLDSQGNLARWSTTGGEHLATMTLPPGRITSIAADGDLVFGSTQVRTLCVYTSDGRLVRQISVPEGGTLKGVAGKLLSVSRGQAAQLLDFSALESTR